MYDSYPRRMMVMSWAVFVWFLICRINTLGVQATVAPSPTRSTSSPTLAPTSPTLPPSAATPNQATSRRITSQQECFKQGRQINCAWNPQIVEYDGFARICEPTERFLETNITASCVGLSNLTCTFNSFRKCVGRSEEICIEPPLWRLLERAKSLMRLSTSLSTEALGSTVTVQGVLRRTYQCTEVTNNITCEATPYCRWRPSAETPCREVTEGIGADPEFNSTLMNFTGNGEQVVESQIIQLIDDSGTARSDLKTVSVVSPKSLHENLITITTQIRWVVQPGNQTGIQSGSFSLSYSDTGVSEFTDPIPFNASPGQLETILRKLASLSDVQVTSNLAGVDEYGRMSWLVKAQNVAFLSVRSSAFIDTAGRALPNESARVMITKHQRNRQIIMMFGPTPAQIGSFALGYTWVDYPPDWTEFHQRTREFFPAFATMLPLPERFDPSDSVQTFQRKLNNFYVRGIKVLDFVSVSEPDPDTFASLATKADVLGIGSNLQKAWIVEFTTLVSQYERAEFPLKVISIPVSGEGGATVPFYGVYGEGGSFMTFSAQVDVPSPVVHGNLGRPQFITSGEPLPGLFAANPLNFSQVLSTENVTLEQGECFKLGGKYYWVEKVTFFDASPPSQYEATIHVTSPVNLTVHANDTGPRSFEGWQAFSCQPILSTTESGATVNTVNTRNSASEIRTALEQASKDYFTSVRVLVNSRNAFGEFTFNLTVEDADGWVPKIEFVSLDTTDVLLPVCNQWAPDACAKIVVQDITPGIGKASGTFRLFFAGYGGKDTDYLRLFSPSSPLNSPQLKLEDGAGKLEYTNPEDLGAPKTVLYYTGPLRVSDFANEDYMMNAMKSLTPDIIELKSTVFEVHVLSPTSIRVRFLLNSVEFAKIWFHSANVPQLIPVSYVKRSLKERGLLGSAVNVAVYTEIQGEGTLYNQVLTIEKAEDLYRSPCSAEPIRRMQDLVIAYGDAVSLENLDQQAEACAFFGGEEESKCTGPEAVVQGCSWRGPSSGLMRSPPPGVDTQVISRFWQTDEYFKWGEDALTVNSNCTVSLVNAIGSVVAILKPMNERLLELNNTLSSPVMSQKIQEYLELYKTVGSHVEKFDRCGRNPVVEAKATQSTFVDVWQWLVTTTSYTCMFAYGLAGSLLAYRMDKFKLLGFKWWDASSGVLIILGSACLGGIYGFAIGAVPAALISQMYASIPVNLSIDWAISLGVAQGILIIYFDMGRGGAGAEIAFKHGLN